MLASLPGTTLPDQTVRWLEKGLAGVLLFARNIPDAAAFQRLCAAIREVKPDALVALDEEGGEVTRLEARTGSSWPGARVLGVVDDTALTAEVAVRLAASLLAGGANVNLAPVADVATGTTNPVIGNRSFGGDASLVGRHVVAWVRASQAAGVAACAKHFPGHGAAGADSHLELPTVDLSREAIAETHVAPFEAAVDAGLAMLMTAHVRFPALDERPATLSPTILDGLARKQLGFEGVIVTDALGMGAIARYGGVVDGAAAAIAAGADLLCVDVDLELQQQVLAGLEDAWRSGQLSMGRVESAVARVGHLAERFAPPAAGGPTQAFPTSNFEVGLEAARRALRASSLPPLVGAAPFIVELSTRSTVGGDGPAPGWGPRLGESPGDGAPGGPESPPEGPVRMRLLDAFRRRDPCANGTAPDQGATAADVLTMAGARPLVLATRDARRNAEQARLVAEVTAARPDAVVVALGSEADAELAPGRTVPARGSAPPNLVAAAEALTSP